jgi:hypothetical protein
MDNSAYFHIEVRYMSGGRRGQGFIGKKGDSYIITLDCRQIHYFDGRVMGQDLKEMLKEKMNSLEFASITNLSLIRCNQV